MAAGHPRSEAHLEQRAEERAAESAAVAAQTVGRQRTCEKQKLGAIGKLHACMDLIWALYSGDIGP